ncbi:MAG TPA: amidohydrolase [Candidatus Acidoferrum sp.]|nr:amidohydrolase [Candidatus Acidoferrum sp.]
MTPRPKPAHPIVKTSHWVVMFVIALCAVSTSAQTKHVLAQDTELITARYVVTMDASRRIIEDGAIAMQGDLIVAVGTRTELLAKYGPELVVIAAPDGLIMPGLINGHTHAAMTLFRGIKDDVTLQDWLQNYIFPAEARNVTEDFVTWGTRLGVLEMLHGGTTTYTDMYYFEDAVARETKAAGMRGVLGETFIDFPAPDNKTHADALAYTEAFLKHWQGDPLIHAAVAPHSIYTCSEQTLRDAASLARRYHAPIVIHVSETKKEVDDSRAAHNMSPVAWLDHLGVLGPDVVAAHCIWLESADISLLAKSHTGCVNNPSSNMMLASGVAPVPTMLAAGVPVGLGTDGPAGSNNDLDMMEEMDLAAKLQKISRMDPQALSALQAVEMATTGGAKAIHLEKEIGSLEPGKKADLIVIGLNAPHAVPMYDIYSQIVYALKASDVRDTIIGGRIVVQDGKVLTLNEAEILAKAREIAERVKKSLAAQPK